MSGINFNFNRSADPLLGSAPDYSAHFAELEQAQKAIEQKKQAIMKLAQGADPATPPQSPTPVWDAIDELTSEMSPNEFAEMSANDNYKASLQALMEYVGALQLRIIRPQVEQSPEGKKLLEQHLTNIKYLRKAASDSANKKLADFEDYTRNYSHLSWDEYLKTKGGQKK
jgi:hypothetical protein